MMIKLDLFGKYIKIFPKLILRENPFLIISPQASNKATMTQVVIDCKRISEKKTIIKKSEK